MNKVVQLSEPGPNDGKELAIPKDAAMVEMTEFIGGSYFRVEYRDTGRKTELGFPVFARTARIELEAK